MPPTKLPSLKAKNSRPSGCELTTSELDPVESAFQRAVAPIDRAIWVNYENGVPRRRFVSR